jgi:opacity protein-like surface antigen
MKRFILLLFLAVPVLAAAQVADYARTLPVRSYSVGIVPAWYLDSGHDRIGLRSVGVEADQGGALAVGLTGGYGVNYSMDLGLKAIYVLNGRPFFGADLQYLVYETRQSYVSLVGGLHYWDNVGVDLTGLFTFAPRYNFNFTAGLDLDVIYDPEMTSRVRTRFWVPVNVGWHISDYTVLFAEYNLQVSNNSWGIVALGGKVIIR